MREKRICGNGNQVWVCRVSNLQVSSTPHIQLRWPFQWLTLPVLNFLHVQWRQRLMLSQGNTRTREEPVPSLALKMTRLWKQSLGWQVGKKQTNQEIKLPDCPFIKKQRGRHQAVSMKELWWEQNSLFHWEVYLAGLEVKGIKRWSRFQESSQRKEAQLAPSREKIRTNRRKKDIRNRN